MEKEYIEKGDKLDFPIFPFCAKHGPDQSLSSDRNKRSQVSLNHSIFLSADLWQEGDVLETDYR